MQRQSYNVACDQLSNYTGFESKNIRPAYKYIA